MTTEAAPRAPAKTGSAGSAVAAAPALQRRSRLPRQLQVERRLRSSENGRPGFRSRPSGIAVRASASSGCSALVGRRSEYGFSSCRLVQPCPTREELKWPIASSIDCPSTPASTASHRPRALVTLVGAGMRLFGQPCACADATRATERPGTSRPSSTRSMRGATSSRRPRRVVQGMDGPGPNGETKIEPHSRIIRTARRSSRVLQLSDYAVGPEVSTVLKQATP